MDTSNDGVSIEVNGAVGVVTFSRPPLNYFDEPLIDALADALESIDEKPELRAVLLRSEGKVFCAGAKFSGSEGTSTGQRRQGQLSDPSDIYRKAIRLFRTRKPIVVAVQGAAIGGGLGLSMIGDFRVAAKEARFAGNFVKIGIHPGFGLTHTLPRTIGQQAASLLLLTGRRIDGVEARKIGLADMVVDLSDLGHASLDLARELAEGAPLALESTRATLRTRLADEVAKQTEHECREQISLFRTEDFKEGVKAVAERRLGNWKQV